MNKTTLEEMKKDLPTVAGRVEAVNDCSDKNYFGVRINDEWLNGRGSTEISTGDVVELKVTENRDNDEVFIDIMETNILEETLTEKEKPVGGVESSNAQRENKGDNSRSGSSNNFTSKSRDISIKVALKTAAEHAGTRPSDDQARHLDEVNELANGYLNIMEGLKGGTKNV